MITNINSDRFVVVSDMHLGNPFFEQKKELLKFLKWAAKEGYDIVINGDGLEIAQVSFRRLAEDVPDFLRVLTQLHNKNNDIRIWYVVGNHDMLMENFLHDWGAFQVCPFLNLQSGDLRIRVEHGHLYDPFFVRTPRLYEVATFLGGLLLRFAPNLYSIWVAFERWRGRIRAKRFRSLINGEPPAFGRAANELARRGFDAVIFGHTHHAGEAELETGGRYINSGSWMLGRTFVEVKEGGIRLLRWKVS